METLWNREELYFLHHVLAKRTTLLLLRDKLQRQEGVGSMSGYPCDGDGVLFLL